MRRHLRTVLAAVLAVTATVAVAQEVPRRSAPPVLRDNTAAQAPAPQPVAPVARRIVPSAALPETTPTIALPSDGETVAIPMNSARVITLPGPAANVVVANETIADVHFDTAKPDQMFVLARSVGATTIFVLDSRGRMTHRAAIRVDADQSSLSDALSELMPSEDISINAFGNSVFLRGKVRNPATAARAVEVASQLLPQGTNLVNMLEIQGRQQVILQVRVAEMDRTIAKNLRFETNIGANTIGALGGRGFAVSMGQSTLSRSTSDIATGSLNLKIPFLDGAAYGLLEQQGYAKTLAEPTLVALSGETANFTAGGEYPFPTGIDDNGNVVFEFRDYGIKLNFTPVVLDEGNINLAIAMEVSEIDNTSTVTVGTLTMPAISQKRTETVVDVPSGGSLMISGLLNESSDNTVAGFPFLKNIPILGTLFRSTQFYSNQTELVILVNVFQAKPVSVNDGLALPTDGLLPPTDVDIWALGRLYRQYDENGEKAPDLSSIIPLAGPFGYILDSEP